MSSLAAGVCLVFMEDVFQHLACVGFVTEPLCMSDYCCKNLSLSFNDGVVIEQIPAAPEDPSVQVHRDLNCCLFGLELSSQRNQKDNRS